MAGVTFYKHNKGFDYGYAQGFWDFSKLYNNGLGFTFVGRYIDGSTRGPKINPKCLTRKEVAQLTSYNLTIIPIFEKNETRAIQNTLALSAQCGSIDGAQAAADLDFLGFTNGTKLIVALGDTDITAATIDRVVAYYNAFVAACNPNKYQCGVYGDYDVIDALGKVSALNVQANAPGWSNFKIHPLAHLLQMNTYNRYDPLVVLRTFTIEALAGFLYNNPPTNTIMFSAFDPKNGKYGAYPYPYPYNPNLPKLKKGSTGQAVMYLQAILKFFVDSSLPINGTFGPKTHNAVLEFQKKYRDFSWNGGSGPQSLKTYLFADGIVGRQTWGVINSLALGFWYSPNKLYK